MAATKSAKYPYQWADGSWYSIPAAQHAANVAALAKPGSPAAAPAEVPLPPDPGYEQQRAGYEQTRDTRIAGLTGERTRGLGDYGFSEDPTTGALAFDPNNPFSKASLLKKNYDVSRARTGNQMAATGGLYSGAYQTAQDSLNRGQLGDEDTLQKSLGSFLSQNTGAKTQAGIDYDINVGGINQADRALQNPLYTPTVPLDPALPTVSAPNVKPTGGIGKPASRSSNTLLAAPRAPKVTTKTKGKVKTYTRAVKTP